MTGRGRPAALPPDEHRRTPVLPAGGLLVRHAAEDGLRTAVYDFGQLPVPAGLQRELAEAFARRVGPVGTWRSLPSSREIWLVVLLFGRFLADQPHPPRRVRELTPSVWAAFRLSRSSSTPGTRQLRKVATVLRDHPELPRQTRALMVERLRADVVRETAYSDSEFDQLKTTAARIFRTALHRIRANREHLEKWRADGFDAGSPEAMVGEALDHLARTGEAPFSVGRDGRRRNRPEYAAALGGTQPQHTWMRLFLTSAEACALTVLFVATHGWNVTPVMELRVPDASPDAGNPEQVIYRLELEKRRRGTAARYETRNLADWGPSSPGRLVNHALEATSAARQALAALGSPSDRLIIWRRGQRSGDRVFETGFDDNAWHNRRGVFGDAVSLNLRRLRKTVVIAHRRTPIQHSRDTHDTVYLVPDPRTVAEAAPQISAGVTDAITAAYTTFNAQVSRAATDPRRDTATASCSDYTASPFSEAGQPCRASFLTCTACPNAVVTPRHLPRLAYLHQALAELRGVLPAAVCSTTGSGHISGYKTCATVRTSPPPNGRTP